MGSRIRKVRHDSPGKRLARILCCDDDEWVLEISRYVLGPHYDLDLLMDGADVAERCIAGGIDLVLLDVKMPPPNGLEILDTLKGRPDTRDIPVVMLTGDGSPQTVMNARSRGAAGYILKPVKPQALLEKVKVFLGETQAQSPAGSPGGETSYAREEIPAGDDDAGEDHDFEISDLLRSVEADLHARDAKSRAFGKLLETFLLLAEIPSGALFIGDHLGRSYKLGAISNLEEREVLALYNSHWDEVMRTLRISMKDIFSFSDEKMGRRWTFYALKGLGHIPGVFVFPEEMLSEDAEPDPDLFTFMVSAAYLLISFQKETASKSALIGLSRAFSSALDAKDPYTRGHTERVTLFALSINTIASREFLDYYMPEDDLRVACFLHDVGKIGIPDSILKKAAALSKEEFDIMKTHIPIGRRMLEPIPELIGALDGIGHHERYDGKGYPEGLEGEEIPLAARIIAVADTFDAMTSDRPYRKGLDPKIAMEEIKKNAGTQFDTFVVDLFEKAFEDGLVHSIIGMGIADPDEEDEESEAEELRIPDDIALTKRCEEVFARLDEVRFGTLLGQELIAMIHDPNSSIKKLASRMEADPALTTRILQLANSSFYGFSRRIRSVEQGIIVLGLREVKHILYLINMKTLVDAVSLSNFDVARFWEHSLNVGVLSRSLAKRFKDRRLIEESFLAGLMHDIGKLALLNLHPERYETVLNKVLYDGERFYRAERREFGVSHEKAAPYLVKRWNLPSFLVEALRYHHISGFAEGGDSVHRMSRIVRAANILTHLSTRPLIPGYEHYDLNDPVFSDLGMDEEEKESIMEKVERLIDTAGEMMSGAEDIEIIDIDDAVEDAGGAG